MSETVKLIIEIPKEVYKASQIIDAKYEDAIQMPLEAIKNGIPLPEGHGRLIDADACKENKRDFCEESTRNSWYDIIDDLLDDAPTIIEADDTSEDRRKDTE